jgi:hypothetical protein
MTKRFKIAIALAALTAMTSASPAFAGKTAKDSCSTIWNLLVLAKKCA